MHPPRPNASASDHPAANYIVDTLLPCLDGSVPEGRPRPARQPLDAAAAMEVIPVAMSLLSAICSLRISIPADLRPPDSRKAVLLSVIDLHKRFPDGLPRLDPIQDMNIQVRQRSTRRIKQSPLPTHAQHLGLKLSAWYSA